jgi:hypothetical protein
MALATFVSKDFSGSGICATCHSVLVDGSGEDVSMPPRWQGTMMANSSKDPLWQAKVSSEVVRNPALQSVIEGKCAACHMPMAYTEAKANGDPVAILGEGFLQDDHPLHEVALDGVSCTLCHQVQGDNFDTPESFSGGYHIDVSTEPPDRQLYGPYQDPEQSIMRSAVGYTPLYAGHLEEAAFCATCHTLYTPFVDAAGNVLGEFPEQVPYLEWEQSLYGDGVGQDASCQSCHMPVVEGAVVISSVPADGSLPPREPFALHDFVGGNVYMLYLHKSNVGDLGLTTAPDNLLETQDRTIGQLRAAAKLSIQETQLQGEVLNVTLSVTVGTGHKFPTGFPSRRTWVHLTVRDADRQIVFESGRLRSDGSIVGNDADVDPFSFEPHYDLITSPDQVQIYEAIMHDSDGAVTYTLLRGAGYAKDNRLLPTGFDKETADTDTAVWGQAIADQDFLGGSDQLSYQIDVQGHQGPFSVVATLYYQSVSYRFEQDLLQDQTSEVDQFRYYSSHVGKLPVVIAAVRGTVP